MALNAKYYTRNLLALALGESQCLSLSYSCTSTAVGWMPTTTNLDLANFRRGHLCAAPLVRHAPEELVCGSPVSHHLHRESTSSGTSAASAQIGTLLVRVKVIRGTSRPYYMYTGSRETSKSYLVVHQSMLRARCVQPRKIDRLHFIFSALFPLFDMLQQIFVRHFQSFV